MQDLSQAPAFSLLPRGGVRGSHLDLVSNELGARGIQDMWVELPPCLFRTETYTEFCATRLPWIFNFEGEMKSAQTQLPASGVSLREWRGVLHAYAGRPEE